MDSWESLEATVIVAIRDEIQTADMKSEIVRDGKV